MPESACAHVEVCSRVQRILHPPPILGFNPECSNQSRADTCFTSFPCDASPRYPEVKTNITGLDSLDKKMIVFDLVKLAAVDLNVSR